MVTGSPACNLEIAGIAIPYNFAGRGFASAAIAEAVQGGWGFRSDKGMPVLPGNLGLRRSLFYPDRCGLK